MARNLTEKLGFRTVVVLGLGALAVGAYSLEGRQAQAESFRLLGSASSSTSDAEAVIPDFHQVSSGIFRGSRPVGKDAFDALEKAGVRTIIDLQGGDGAAPIIGGIVQSVEGGESEKDIANEEDLAKGYGIFFLNFPLNSFLMVGKSEAQQINTILDVMNNPIYQPAYVHCAHGHDRTGMVIALYRVKYQGWDIEAAHDEMIAMGHNGFLNRIFTYPMDVYFYREARRLKGIPEPEHIDMDERGATRLIRPWTQRTS